MAYLRSLPDEASLLEVMRAHPETAGPLLDYHQALLRGPSPFTVAERELIAAYVSGLNACGYCHGIHRVTAEAFGIPVGTVTALLDDVDTAPVEDRMRPVLRYVGKLTLTPSRMTPADAEAVFAAGWDDTALHDAVSVCALFNMMNRLADGLRVTVGDGYLSTAGKRLADIGYTGLKDLL